MFDIKSGMDMVLQVRRPGRLVELQACSARVLRSYHDTQVDGGMKPGLVGIMDGLEDGGGFLPYSCLPFM